MKIFLSCLLLPPPYFFIPLIIYLLQYSLSFGKYYITRSFRGSAPLLRAPVVGWEAIQAPRALQAPGPFRYCGGLWPPGPFRHCGSLWPHFHYNIVIFHIHYFIFMKIGRQFPNHPGGMSHCTLLFYTGTSPGGLLSSAKDELKFISYIRLLKCPWLMEIIKK